MEFAMNDEFLWVEKYRPHTIDDTILSKDLKNTFKEFVAQKNIPNLILSGSAGIGKTTVARAMLEEIDADYYIINGSMNGNIDTLRNDIQSFASTVSFKDGRKYVILDEADYLNPNSTQPALRNFMEEFSRNCGFILTCNFKNRIIQPLHSRCSVIDFKITNEDMPKMAAQFFKRVCTILTLETIEFDRAVIAEIINKHFPDWRRVLNELQRYAATGKIDSGILVNMSKESIDSLIQLMKSKNFTECRKWIAENSNNDPSSLFNEFYENSVNYFKPNSIPQLVLIISKYQYQAAFVSSHEINLAACILEIMTECEFK
jgi:DNA polymerase III delta prime subunit